ncbi:unnamed protein product [Dibothriocephalus latus]|uniref:Uncharacterized protein n=1 Tax=Dibothriocephalus latus TaxID=60516 RepID=A0A3P6T988_DIBLA|nr:unnamed protein product [Dibothriocephalus latus]
MPNRIAEQQGTLMHNNATHFSQLSSLDCITPSERLPRTPYVEDDAFRSPTPTSCYYNLRSATSYQDVFLVQRSSTTGARNSPVPTTPSFQVSASIR